MLLVIGEAITAFMRTIKGNGPDVETSFEGPVASGAPMIFASAAARLGINTVALMAVGNDDFGIQMRDVLNAHGVDTSHCLISKTRPTSCGFVTYRADGSRSFIFYVHETSATEVPPVSLKDLPESADVLHISGSALSFGGELAATVKEAIARAKRAGKKISVDPNVRAETASEDTLMQVRAAVLEANYILPSHGELDALGLSVTDLILAGKVVVVKEGAKGATVFTSEQGQFVPAPKVSELNADGAGDIFAATFIAAVMQQKSPVRAAEIACDVAARSVTSSDPMNSLIQPSDLL
ncbi:MAG: sugar kinase [Trueperaceae bacterium]|nr:sugar kinase [Trueperaceae bacterium]